MGFFDKLKDKRELDKQDRASQREATAAGFALRDQWLGEADKLAAQYSGAIEAAGSVSIADLQKTAARMQRITSQGVDGKATVISARELGEGMGGVGVSVELDLDLITGPGAPRKLTIRQDVMGGAATYTPGLEVTLKIDPENPQDALIWADVDQDTRRAATAASGLDPTAHLDALSQLHDRGQLSDEQFEQAKARLLGP
jgi:Short C-terminal domain